MGGDDRELVRAVYYLTREQKRWLKQRALDQDVQGGASEVLRRLLQDRLSPPVKTADPEVTG